MSDRIVGQRPTIRYSSLKIRSVIFTICALQTSMRAGINLKVADSRQTSIRLEQRGIHSPTIMAE